jgi:hypothetical protein
MNNIAIIVKAKQMEIYNRLKNSAIGLLSDRDRDDHDHEGYIETSVSILLTYIKACQNTSQLVFVLFVVVKSVTTSPPSTAKQSSSQSRKIQKEAN